MAARRPGARMPPDLTNDDMAQIVAAVPDLEGLELKPAGTGARNNGVFASVGKLKKLRVLQLVGLSVRGSDRRHLAFL